MSDTVKWATLTAITVALFVSLGALGLLAGTTNLSSSVAGIVNIAGDFIFKGRSLINNFLTPFGRSFLSTLLFYIFFRWLAIMAVRLSSAISHFIFG